MAVVAFAGLALLAVACGSKPEPASTLVFERQRVVPALEKPATTRFPMTDFATNNPAGEPAPTFGAGGFACSGADVAGGGAGIQLLCTSFTAKTTFGIDFQCAGHSSRNPQSLHLSESVAGTSERYLLRIWCE